MSLMRPMTAPHSDSPRVARAFSAYLLGLLAACGTIGCDGGDSPTAVPSASPVSPTSPYAVTAYLDTVVRFTQTYFYFGDRIDWTALRQRATTRAGGAQTVRQIYPAIDTLVLELTDPHSFFLPPSQTLGNREDPSGPMYTPMSRVIAPGIGYLWLTSFGGRNSVGRADTLQRLIAEVDSIAGGACGWIIDLRANIGGFWPPMLAGISPLVTPGIAGGFVERDPKKRFNYYVYAGVAGLESPTGQRWDHTVTPRSYDLRRRNPPIALLHGRYTASAGEIVVLAFKDSTRAVRTFGGATTGLTTQPYTYTFRDTASLGITAAMMFDRSGRTYGGGSIPPDQVASGAGIGVEFTPAFRPATRGEEVIEAAVNWMESRPECRSSVSARILFVRRLYAACGSRRRRRPVHAARPTGRWECPLPGSRAGRRSPRRALADEQSDRPLAR